MLAVRSFTCVDCGSAGEQQARGRKRLRCEPCGKARSAALSGQRSWPERKAARSVAQCEGCGRDYPKYRREQRWCSMACGNRYKAGAGPRGGRDCEICGASYKPSYPLQRTCGRVCGFELRRREGKFKRERRKWPKCDVRYQRCLECDALFVARQERSLLCSARCAARRSYWERKALLPATRPCLCGAPVERPRRVCDECLRQHRIERKKQEKRRRRAAKRGGLSEPYTLAEIAARDRSRCALCGGRVAMQQVVPHPKAPTIDHVVPVSEGGDDTRANVQLAHFRCNSVKGARGSQQLALIG